MRKALYVRVHRSHPNIILRTSRNGISLRRNKKITLLLHSLPYFNLSYFTLFLLMRTV